MSIEAKLLVLIERGEPGEQAAARVALASARARRRKPAAAAPIEPGPLLTKSGGRPYSGRISEGRLWIAVAVDPEQARAWVLERSRVRVKVGGDVFEVDALEVEEDDGRAWLAADVPG
jgi:hypothetical protein